MTKLIIIRHGFSSGNKQSRFSVQLDLPLTKEGYDQAESAAQYILKNYQVDAVYSSDLCRAYDTVKPIADALDLPIHTYKELREINEGNWQGMLKEEVKKQFPEQFKTYQKTLGLVQFEGGECYASMLARVKPIIEKIIDDNPQKTVVIGTHGAVIRGMLSVWLGVPLEKVQEVPRVPNGTITVVECDQASAKVLQIGYSDHLTERTGETSPD